MKRLPHVIPATAERFYAMAIRTNPANANSRRVGCTFEVEFDCKIAYYRLPILKIVKGGVTGDEEYVLSYQNIQEMGHDDWVACEGKNNVVHPRDRLVVPAESMRHLLGWLRTMAPIKRFLTVDTEPEMAFKNGNR